MTIRNHSYYDNYKKNIEYKCSYLMWKLGLFNVWYSVDVFDVLVYILEVM